MDWATVTVHGIWATTILLAWVVFMWGVSRHPYY
jgi:hypothetical protein